MSDKEPISLCLELGKVSNELNEANNRVQLLAEALEKCIMASGIVRRDIDGLSVAELLHFAEDLRGMLDRGQQHTSISNEILHLG
jgi:hypothetical protein